jgi:hypothetical protein
VTSELRSSTNIYLGTVHTQKYKRSLSSRASPEQQQQQHMKSIIYVLSPLPMIDSIATFCQSIKTTIENDDERNVDGSGNGNGTSSQSSTLRIPLTSFQKLILRLNTETICHHLHEPFRRERVAEYYVTPPGQKTKPSFS